MFTIATFKVWGGCVFVRLFCMFFFFFPDYVMLIRERDNIHVCSFINAFLVHSTRDVWEMSKS